MQRAVAARVGSFVIGGDVVGFNILIVIARLDPAIHALSRREWLKSGPAGQARG
jgi:hypothetical protein